MTDSEIAILGLLAEKPRYGYELDKIIEQRGMREWTDIAFSSIYAVLRSLENQGFVSAETEVEGNRVRKLFALTKDGKRSLREALKALITEPAPPKDVMMLVLANAGVLNGDESALAFAARIKDLEQVKARLSAKLSENAKSPTNVRQMFERSLAQIDYEIEFAKTFVGEVASAAEPVISEVASAPAEPRNDVKRPEATGNDVKPPEAEPAISEVASSADIQPPSNDIERPDDEPKDTLF